MSEREQYDMVCKPEFAEIKKLLYRLDEGVRGNGKDGIVVRLDRLEGSERRRSRILWLILGAVVILGGTSVAQLLGLG